MCVLIRSDVRTENDSFKTTHKTSGLAKQQGITAGNDSLCIVISLSLFLNSGDPTELEAGFLIIYAEMTVLMENCPPLDYKWIKIFDTCILLQCISNWLKWLKSFNIIL